MNKQNLYFPKYLNQTLEKIVNYPLTIVVAGSGYGKTTAVSSFFNKQSNLKKYCYTFLGEPTDKAWHNMARIFCYIDEAVGNYLQNINEPKLEELGDISFYLNQLNCYEETILIFDNFHQSGFQEIEILLQVLAGHNCDNLHIVLLTQPLIDIELEALNLNNMHLINQDDLKYDQNSIVGFFRNDNLILLNEQLEYLEKYSEGWVAALRLQLIEYKKNNRFYQPQQFKKLLKDVFWNYLTDEEKELFLIISIFDEITFNELKTIIEIKGFNHELSYKLRTFVFVQWDRINQTYTLHTLLKDMLIDILNNDGGYVQSVYYLAGTACLKIKNNILAMKFFLKAQKYEEILKMDFNGLEMEEFVRYQNEKELDAFFKTCLNKFFYQYPNMLLRFCLENFMLQNYQWFEILFCKAKELEQYDELYNEEQLNEIKGRVAFIESLMAFNDIEKMCYYQQLAKQFLKNSEVGIYHPHDTWTFGSPSVVYLYWSKSGNLDYQYRLAEKGMPDYWDLSNKHGYGGIVAMKSEMALLRGDDETSEILCYKAIYQAKSKQQDGIVVCAYLTLLRVAIFNGNEEMFNQVNNDLCELVMESSHVGLRNLIDGCNAYINMLLGFEHRLPSWLLNLEEVKNHCYGLAVSFYHVITAKYLLKHDYYRFEGVIDELIKVSETVNFLMPKVYYFIYLAIGKKEINQMSLALENLNQALDLALKDDIYLPFVENYDDLNELLEIILTEYKPKNKIKVIICHGKKMTKGKKKIRKVILAKEHKLTPREKEIAVLAKNRYSAKEIAEQLFISVTTVNSTLRTIYNKLEIHSKKELAKIEF